MVAGKSQFSLQLYIYSIYVGPYGNIAVNVLAVRTRGIRSHPSHCSVAPDSHPRIDSMIAAVDVPIEIVDTQICKRNTDGWRRKKSYAETQHTGCIRSWTKMHGIARDPKRLPPLPLQYSKIILRQINGRFGILFVVFGGGLGKITVRSTHTAKGNAVNHFGRFHIR